MKTGCSPYNTTLNGDESLRPLAGHNHPVPSISQLPTELVVKILQFTLPPIDFALYDVKVQVLSYMRTLFAIRLIAKRCQEIVDGTPAFWTFIMSALPPHVNETTITRSGNGPLTIIYISETLNIGHDDPSAQDFVDSLAHTFSRWSAYSGPLVSGYFDKPVARLQTIVLRSGGSWRAFELVGGSTTNLRHIDLSNLSIRWKTGLFAQLKVLKLRGALHRESTLTTTLLLDSLRASQGLEHLELAYMSATTDHLPCSPVLTHPRLRYINFDHCHYRFAGAILHHIRAPSCTEFHLRISENNYDENLPIFLNEDLGPFKELLHAIHSRNGSSEIILDGFGFDWNSRAEDAEHPLAFSVSISCQRPTPYISWVEHVLKGNPGLNIHFCFDPDLDQEVLESIKPMRCVTTVEIDIFVNVDRCLLALKFMGELLSTDPALPPLPCLQELLLTGAEWTDQNVLDMVRSRFNSLLWESTKRTPLTISMSRGAFTNFLFPRPISALATLARIRETDGVECVRFVGPEELDGTLAITWDEMKSAPAWG